MIYLQWIHADSSWLPCHPQKLPGTEVRLTEIRPLCPPSCSFGVIIAFFQVSGTSPDLHNLSKVIWWLASLWCGPALVDESCQGPWTSRPQVCPGVSRIHPSWPRESLPSNIPLSWICESKIPRLTLRTDEKRTLSNSAFSMSSVTRVLPYSFSNRSTLPFVFLLLLLYLK